MPTHVITQSVNVGSVGRSGSKEYTADTRETYEIAIASDASDFEIEIVIAVANIASLVILADQDLTLETNSAGAPVDTVPLKANVPLIMNTDDYFTTKPIAPDVTSLFVTNGSAVATTLYIELLRDATP